MEPDELTLSDVHVGRTTCPRSSETPEFIGDYQVAGTRFEFETLRGCSPPGDPVSAAAAAAVEVDEDGDLVLPRKQHRRDVIVIEHTLSTRLQDVGLQVWQGSLLLGDYILANYDRFHGCSAIELGAGVGLTGIVMATCAKNVICTDIGTHVLDTCQRNVQNNRSLYEFDDAAEKEQTVIKVREWDWTQQELKKCITVTGTDRYSWRPEDLELLQQTRVLLAADVVYDIDLTEAFFCTIHRTMSQPPGKTVYISQEKRLNFTLSDLDVACPTYDHFRDCLNSLTDSDITAGPKFKAEQLSIDYPQYFQYERTKYLELWKITSSFEDG